MSEDEDGKLTLSTLEWIMIDLACGTLFADSAKTKEMWDGMKLERDQIKHVVTSITKLLREVEPVLEDDQK